MSLASRRRAMMGAKTEQFTHGTWPDLFRAIDAGTYATEYSMGEVLPLDLGAQGVVNAVIVAFNTDDKADGTGKAPITFIAQHGCETKRRANPGRKTNSEGVYIIGTGTFGGWPASEMYTYTKETLRPLIPTEVRSRIVQVTKYTNTYDQSQTLIYNDQTIEDVWIPSLRELNGSGTTETVGVQYSWFSSDARRKKKRPSDSGYNQSWWTRTPAGTNYWGGVYSAGQSGTGQSLGTTQSFMYVIGFCVG